MVIIMADYLPWLVIKSFDQNLKKGNKVKFLKSFASRHFLQGILSPIKKVNKLVV